MDIPFVLEKLCVLESIRVICLCMWGKVCGDHNSSCDEDRLEASSGSVSRKREREIADAGKLRSSKLPGRRMSMLDAGD